MIKWLNCRMFVYELSGCGVGYHCGHLNHLLDLIDLQSLTISYNDNKLQLIARLEVIPENLFCLSKHDFVIRMYDYPANIYLSKVNNRNTRKICEICS